jgi:hypothetical protein
MKLPNARSARFDVNKLVSYSLDPHHTRGGDKARVFRAALGIDGSHAEWLRMEIMKALPDAAAKATLQDNYGMRYAADVTVARQNREAVIRTAWIIRDGEDFPRFISAWVR